MVAIIFEVIAAILTAYGVQRSCSGEGCSGTVDIFGEWKLAALLPSSKSEMSPSCTAKQV